MRNKGMKVFAFLAVMLMLVSVLPTGALASQDGGQGNAKDVTKYTRDEIKNQTREKIRTQLMENASEDSPMMQAGNQKRGNGAKAAGKDFKNAKDQYNAARENFQKVKVKGNGESADSEEFINATKDYLNSTIDYMIEQLEQVQENIDGESELANAEYEMISNYIDQLEAERENVENAQTRQELAESSKSIRDIWKDAQKGAKLATAKSMNNRLNNFLDKSESISLRLEKEIDRLKAQGVDTTELEGMLEDYNELIAGARENHELAMVAYQNNDAKGANKQLRATVQNMKQAGKVLKNMVKEFKEHRQGVVVLGGSGTLVAEGDGNVVISGNLRELDVSARNATLVVKDLADDSVIDIDVDSYLFSNKDVGSSESNNRALVFHGFDGNAIIKGSRLTVLIKGEGVSLEVDGMGKAILSGTGSYSVSGESSGEWFETDEVDGNYESETPVNGTPTVPVNETSVEETPTVPVNETPVNETPTVPVNETSLNETPTVPVNETSLNETPTVPVNETSVEETPTVPVNGTPVEETPTVPVNETNNSDVISGMDL